MSSKDAVLIGTALAAITSRRLPFVSQMSFGNVPETKIRFSQEELEELRRLPKKEKSRAVHALKEKYRAEKSKGEK